MRLTARTSSAGLAPRGGGRRPPGAGPVDQPTGRSSSPSSILRARAGRPPRRARGRGRGRRHRARGDRRSAHRRPHSAWQQTGQLPTGPTAGLQRAQRPAERKAAVERSPNRRKRWWAALDPGAPNGRGQRSVGPAPGRGPQRGRGPRRPGVGRGRTGRWAPPRSPSGSTWRSPPGSTRRGRPSATR